MTTPHHTAQLDLENGFRIAYSQRGQGEPVLFIQGVGVHGHGWQPQIDVLSKTCDCVWFDNRGIGESTPEPAEISVRHMADDAAALIAAQGWTAAHVVGHSMGGLIAMRLALTHRARVKSLALLCTFARGRDAGASARMAWIGLRSRVGTRRMRRAAFLEMLAAPDALRGIDRQRYAAELAPLFGHDLADHSPMEMRQLAAIRREDVRADLGQLAGLPTLVVSGAHDPIASPTLGEAIARGIPCARFVVLSDQSHGAPVMAAAEINALLAAHMHDMPEA